MNVKQKVRGFSWAHPLREVPFSSLGLGLWVCVCVLSMGGLHAAAAATFDEAKVWQYTQTHHPLFRRFQQALQVAKAIKRGRGSFPTNPALSFEGGVQSPSAPAGGSVGVWMPDLEAGFSWAIPIGGRWQKSKELAGQRLRAARILFSLRTLQLHQRVQKTLYSYQRYKKAVEVYKKIAHFHQKINALIQKRERNGVGNKLNVAMTQIEALRTRQESWQARIELVAAARKLQQAMGWGKGSLPSFAVGLTPKMVVMPKLKVLLAGLTQHPRLRLARQRQKIVEAQLKLAKSRAIPDLTLTATYAQSMGAHIIRGGISIPIPILWRNQPAVQQHRASLVKQKTQVAYVRLMLRNQLRNAYRRYQLSRRALRQVKTSLLPKLQKRSAMIARGFKEGQLTLVRWLLAQQSLTRGELSYIRATKEATDAYLALLWAAQGSFSKDTHRTQTPPTKRARP